MPQGIGGRGVTPGAAAESSALSIGPGSRLLRADLSAKLSATPRPALSGLNIGRDGLGARLVLEWVVTPKGIQAAARCK